MCSTDPQEMNPQNTRPPRWKHDDVFVLDSTVHAYNPSEENYVEGPYKHVVGARISDEAQARIKATLEGGGARDRAVRLVHHMESEEQQGESE